MDLRIKNCIEEKLSDKIISESSASGGCISKAFEIKLYSGKKYFLKYNNDCPEDFFLKEASGLNELAKSNAIRTPKVILTGTNFILLEYISSNKKQKNFFEYFGSAFAQLHKSGSESFGFKENNYLGSTVQLNLPDENEARNWTEFYFNKRLLFQFKLAEKNGYADEKLRKKFIALESKLKFILSGSEEKPSLLHGDLWSGNFMADESGSVCLIDPAVYYGHREADLAMTHLFGGFPEAFYSSYNNSFPLKDGFQYRENIYKLYHVLNHLNLFGFPYYGQAISLMEYYL